MKRCEHIIRAVVALAKTEQMRYGQRAAQSHDNDDILEAMHKGKAMADFVRKVQDQWRDA